MVPVFHRVFEVAPVFRAEKHGTSRHINEYTSMDVEMGPIKSFKDIMNLEVKLLKYLLDFLNDNYK
jgi:nondiscriminating aspartyl-tRNA synthetase